MMRSIRLIMIAAAAVRDDGAWRFVRHVVTGHADGGSVRGD